mmetsp:Transcript_26688/g.41768  ORF Transcript_26688/g.41768 Transcript_26688/m.41768 type:complete len:96 (-) Transcript_26688:346-633(-)
MLLSSSALQSLSASQIFRFSVHARHDPFNQTELYSILLKFEERILAGSSQRAGVQGVSCLAKFISSRVKKIRAKVRAQGRAPGPDNRVHISSHPV